MRLNNAVKVRHIGLGRQLYRTEALEISNAIRGFVPNLFWTNSKSQTMLQLLDFRPDIIWNHFGTSGGSFVTKEGSLFNLPPPLLWFYALELNQILLWICERIPSSQ